MIDPRLAALENDSVIDISTTGRLTGEFRRVEIWCRVIARRVFVTGTPGLRGWYANLLANPELTVHIKESFAADFDALARPITNDAERRCIFEREPMSWYRQRGGGVDALVAGSPLIEVTFSKSG